MVIYIVATIFFTLHRVRSRVLIVPFKLPCTGPVTGEEFVAWEEYEEALQSHKFNAAIGWIVKQKQILKSEGKVYVQAFKKDLKDKVGLMKSARNVIGWGCCLFLLKQVSSSSSVYNYSI